MDAIIIRVKLGQAEKDVAQAFLGSRSGSGYSGKLLQGS